VRLDPVVATLLRFCFGLLFAVAALHKLFDFGAFSITLRKYLDGMHLSQELRATRAVGSVVLASEFALAMAFALPAVTRVAALGAATLLVTYAAAMYVNVRRGNVLLDCGCSWGAQRQPLTAALVVRNVALALLALAMMLPTAARPLSLIDLISILAAAGGLAVIYSAVNLLLAAGTAREAR
jgi:uncharacterized membrane protein YphA (DoxX/SURF4 family)